MTLNASEPPSSDEHNANSAPAARTPRAAYIHVPFCVHRCGYCDFTLVANRDDLVDDYLQALEQELQLQDGVHEVDTLFFGGGTPTQLQPEKLERLFQIVLNTFPVSDSAEVSVEANPDGFSRTKVGILADAGVNRISLGAQSFDSLVLNTLQRRHSAADIVRAIALARTRIQNLGLDLIFAVPGQSIDCWRRTLEYATEIDVNHISTYGLTWEKGTQFWQARETGTLRPIDDETERAMYDMAMTILPEHNFAQYEISNFAQPGFACRHNETYWNGDEYFAAGPGAARYVNGTRETNHRSVLTWLKRMQAGESPVDDSETLPPESVARELLMLGLRRTAGLHIPTFEARTQIAVGSLAQNAIEKYVDLGWLEFSDDHLRLTRSGRFMADSVVSDML